MMWILEHIEQMLCRIRFLPLCMVVFMYGSTELFDIDHPHYVGALVISHVWIAVWWLDLRRTDDEERRCSKVN